MSDTLEGLDLEAIKRRCAGATSGPWRDAFLEYPGMVIDANGYHFAQVDDGGNREFIAAARMDIPALIDEVERLRGEARAQQDDARGWRPIHEWFAEGGERPWSVLVVLYDDDGVSNPIVGEARFFDEEGWYWAGNDPSDYHAHQIFPTYFRELPKPPAAPREQSGEEKGDG